MPPLELNPGHFQEILRGLNIEATQDVSDLEVNSKIRALFHGQKDEENSSYFKLTEGLGAEPNLSLIAELFDSLLSQEKIEYEDLPALSFLAKTIKNLALQAKTTIISTSNIDTMIEFYGDIAQNLVGKINGLKEHTRTFNYQALADGTEEGQARYDQSTEVLSEYLQAVRALRDASKANLDGIKRLLFKANNEEREKIMDLMDLLERVA